MKTALLRGLILIHRYVGIAVGWLMLMWCLSGMVMLYSGYPAVGAAERHAALASLKATACCHLPAELFDAGQTLSGFNVEMLNGRPVLRMTREFGAPQLIDLQTGASIEAITAGDAMSVARDFVNQSSEAVAGSEPTLLGLIDHDQWTVYGDEDRRPLYHLALNDAEATELYVSGIDGTLVQSTTRKQRFWSWLGAIPHWLYPTMLRERVVLWTRVVVWSSLVGSFLAAFGLILGIWQLRRRHDQQWHSPYRGWKYWHHVPGLVFGVVVLSWVLSGLLSMNPWGWLETQGQARDAQRIEGELPSWATIRQLLQGLPQVRLPTNTVALESRTLHGATYVVATTRSGERTRFDSTWQITPLRDEEVQQAALALTHGQRRSAAPPILLKQEDDYYYGQGAESVTLPVWRIVGDDAQATRYYLDPITGQLLGKIDRNARWYRWLHSGLHRMDFSVWLRSRPLWDLVMWFLLSGATIVCGTGTWLAVRHLRGK